MNPAIPFLCPENYPSEPAWLTALNAAMPHERVVRLRDMGASERARCEVAIVANPSIDDLKALPSLKWVHSVWAGVERLVAELPNPHLQIVRLVDPQLASTMAEAVLAWTLYLHRDMPRYARQQAAMQWLAHDLMPASEKTVSLLGLGALGLAAAEKLNAAGFRVCGWSRTPKALPDVTCFTGPDGLHTMLAQTDIVVCLLPLTPQTTGTLNAEALAVIPHGASVINFARGPVVVDAALRAALDQGHLAHAVLDVFDVEPLPKHAWQWSHPHVTVLPHISAPTNRMTASAIVAANIREYRASGRLPATVDLALGY